MGAYNGGGYLVICVCGNPFPLHCLEPLHLAGVRGTVCSIISLCDGTNHFFYYWDLSCGIC